MNKVLRKTITAILGTTIGMYMMAAPLTTTVYAAEQANGARNSEFNYNHDGDKKIQRENYERMREKAVWFQRMERYRAWQMKHHSKKYKNPMFAARDVVPQLGFNVNDSKFNVINQTPSQALIQITQSGSNDNINITVQASPDGSWKVASVSQ